MLPVLIHGDIADSIVDADIDQQIEHDVKNSDIVVPPLWRSEQVPKLNESTRFRDYVIYL